MLAEQYVREGRFREGLEALEEQVRNDPASAKLRVFLFQLLAVVGEWDRALTQLQVARDLDPGTLAMMHAYREALRCEVLRHKVFEGVRAPMVLGEPDPWVARLLEALKLIAAGEYARSQQLREEAFAAAPATPGAMDGQRFEWIADADTRLGPVLEALVNGQYYWIPFHRIRAIHIEKPADLRDLVWMPAHFTWANGGESVGLIPTRYPGSQDSDDPLIQTARKTQWVDHPGGVTLGEGQRVLSTDAGDHPLMDIRLISLEPAVTAIEDAEAGAPIPEVIVKSRSKGGGPGWAS